MPEHTSRLIVVGAYALAAAILLVFACSDPMGPQDGEHLTLSFVSTSTGDVAPNGDLLVVRGGHTLAIRAAELVVDDVELAEDEGDGDTDTETDTETEDDTENDTDTDTEDDGDTDNAIAGPLTVDLALDGAIVTTSIAPVESGVYDELEMHVVTVRLVGTYDGEPFDVLVPVNREVELDIVPPFTVGDGSDALNLTIALRIADWFKLPGDMLLDPRTLATDADARDVLRARVLASFIAFEDSDRDGDDADTDTDTERR